MAFNTTRLYVNTDKVKNVPAGSTTDTSPANIGTPSIEETEELTEVAATHVNVTKSTAFDDLMAAINLAVQNLIDNTWGVDVTAKTVDYNAEVVSVKRGQASDDIYLPEANDVFVVRFNLSVVIS